MAVRSPNINVMIGAARKAANRLARDFGEVENLQVSMKGPGDFVSTADIRTERTLRRELERARPDYGFLMEESGGSDGADARHRWIVDPLDGTTNFLHGIPHFAISIALESNGRVVAGVIYEPLQDQMYWAEAGAGAHLNDRRLRVSGRIRMENCLLATGYPLIARTDEERSRYFAELSGMTARTAGVRRFGTASLDLAYVAAGRFDGFWETGLKPWDMAAGIVIVREAGGFVTDVTGGEDMFGTGSIVAANDRIHGEFLAELKDLREASK
jgi:myo-inositol-1(or 4)-monophosphatase